MRLKTTVLSKIESKLQSYRSSTYIYVHYNPSVRIIDVVSHITYVVCINLKSTPNHRFVEKLIKAILFTLSVFARNLLKGNRWKTAFCILFWCLVWGSNSNLMSNKPTHYLLDCDSTSSRLVFAKSVSPNRNAFKLRAPIRVVLFSYLLREKKTST